MQGTLGTDSHPPASAVAERPREPQQSHQHKIRTNRRLDARELPECGALTADAHTQYKHTHTRTPTRSNPHAHAHAHAHAHTNTHARTHTHSLRHTHARTHAHTHTHTHTRARAHTHTPSLSRTNERTHVRTRARTNARTRARWLQDHAAQDRSACRGLRKLPSQSSRGCGDRGRGMEAAGGAARDSVDPKPLNI